MTVTEQILKTYDALRKFTSEVNIMDLQEAVKDHDTIALKLNKLVVYNHELFEIGKFLGDKYIRERNEIVTLMEKVKELENEIENLKNNCKGL